MNKEICKTVLEHRQQLVPALFTERQVNLVQKYLDRQKLTPGEQTYLYSAIRRKMDALRSLQEEYYITGEGIKPERVEKAKQILKKLKYPRAFISGSFLFKEKYNDIDIFVVGRQRKQYQKGKKQFIFLTWNDLSKPIFFSSATCSVSTFSLTSIKPDLRRTSFEEILLSYEVGINEILDNDDQKTLRYILNYYYLNVHRRILSSSGLDQEMSLLLTLPSHQRIAKVNSMMKDILINSFSERYLETRMDKFIQNLKKLKENYPNDNLDIYLYLAEEIKHESRRAQTEA